MGGELLPATALQPCAGAPSGRDICSLAWLTWPRVVIPATMSSLQYRHGAPPRHGTMCRGPPIRWVFIRSVGFYLSLTSTFPAHYRPLHGLVSLLHAIILMN